MAEQFAPVAAYLQEVVDERTIPGAVLRIERNGKLLYETAVGLRHTAPQRPMRVDTLFDVASLTKVVATLGTLLTLFEQNRLSPDTTLGDILPVAAQMRRLTLRQCLTHTAGLPALIFLQESLSETDDVQLEYEPGTRVIYSDIGFLLLGRVIATVMGQPLDVVMRERTTAWGLSETSYNPVDTKRCAATEWREHLGRHQVGEVHDENATVLGGVAGHAGLFSTARDLAAYGALYLPERASAWFARSRECLTDGLDAQRGLGWQTWDATCFAGPQASPEGFGHTGFTGTSLWIDPSTGLVIVLLANAVHFGRNGQMLLVRKRAHTLIFERMRDEV